MVTHLFSLPSQKLEEHSERCLSAAMVDNRYTLTETKMAESQPC